MPYVNLMRIICTKGILNEADPVSRRLDFLPVENVYIHGKSLSWDGNMHVIIQNGNALALHELSRFELLNGDDDFLSQWKGTHSSCKYFSDENIDRRKRQLIAKSFDGLFRYQNRVAIPRLALALIKALLIEYPDNVGHPNYR